MNALPQDLDTRGFYRQQLAAAFHHSRQFSEPLGIAAEQVVETPEFETVLQECAPGSLEAARRIGEMAVISLDRVPTLAGSGAGPCWRDLVNYERGWFLQTATTADAPPANRPRRGVSALCMNFAWAVPEIIERLQKGAPITDHLRRPVTLLFARGRDGVVRVAEVGATVEKVFRATNGLRTQEQIATAAGVDQQEASAILDALAATGAVIPAMSSEQMTRLIEQREKRGK